MNNQTPEQLNELADWLESQGAALSNHSSEHSSMQKLYEAAEHLIEYARIKPQKMETAPKDGRQILMATNADSSIQYYLVRWREGRSGYDWHIKDGMKPYGIKLGWVNLEQLFNQESEGE